MRTGWVRVPRGAWHYVGRSGRTLCNAHQPDPVALGPFVAETPPDATRCTVCERWYNEAPPPAIIRSARG